MASLAQQEHRPRRQPRVAYSAPVRVSGDWSDREPCFVPLLAQTLDLSESGMALVTPLALQPGSIVTCSMRVGGCQLYVVGNVVWERVADDGMSRAGISFLPPNHEDTGLMRRLLDLGKLHPHRIHMRFDGRPDTLTALAQVTRSGLALTAPLPILRRDTGVRFSFDHEGAGGASFRGRIDRVRLAQLEGMPALEVGIRVNDVQAMQGVVDDAAARASQSKRLREDATPIGVEVTPTPAEHAPIGLAARAWVLARALQDRALAVRLPTSLAIVLAGGALVLGALAHELSRPAPSERSEPIITPRLAQAREPLPQLDPAPYAHAPRSAPIVAPAPAPEPEAAPAQPRELVFKWRRMRREIFVPLEGELYGLEHFRVGEPLGITVDLPNARAPEQLERYAVRRPGVQRVDVAPHGRGVRIRVWASRPFQEYSVEPAPGGVRITIPGPFSAR